MKRSGFLLLLLLASGQVLGGEAFKNFNLEEFLGAAFLLLLGAPVAIGLGVYGILRLSDQNYTANWMATVFFSCMAWWFGMFILFNMPANPGRFWLLDVCIGACGAAAGYYLSRTEKPTS